MNFELNYSSIGYLCNLCFNSLSQFISPDCPLGGSVLRRILFCLVSVIAFSAAHLCAADMTFFIGGAKPGSICYHNVKTSLHSSPDFGLRVSTGFVPFFGVEHTLAFGSDYLFPSGTAISEAKGFVYNSNMIFYVPVKSVVRYVTAGVGLLHQYGDTDMPVGTKLRSITGVG
jgi:hypothetical protein